MRCLLPRPETRSIATLTFTITLVLCSCAVAPGKDDAWEGFRHRTLRVHVRIDGSDEQRHGRHALSIDEALLHEAGRRASLILDSFIRMHLVDPSLAASCRAALPAMVENGSVRFRRCTGDTCAAYIDYDAGPCVDPEAP